MKKIIHINKSVIARNVKRGKCDPPITVKTIKDGTKMTVVSNEYCHSVEIKGPSKLVHSKEPLKCGARVWIETHAPVVLSDKPIEGLSKDDVALCSLVS